MLDNREAAFAEPTVDVQNDPLLQGFGQERVEGMAVDPGEAQQQPLAPAMGSEPHIHGGFEHIIQEPAQADATAPGMDEWTAMAQVDARQKVRAKKWLENAAVAPAEADARQAAPAEEQREMVGIRVRSQHVVEAPGGRVTFYSKGFFTAACSNPSPEVCSHQECRSWPQKTSRKAFRTSRSMVAARLLKAD